MVIAKASNPKTYFQKVTIHNDSNAQHFIAILILSRLDLFKSKVIKEKETTQFSYIYGCLSNEDN